MSYRERSAWISLIVTLVVYGGYFLSGGFSSFLGLVGATVAFVIAMVVLTVISAILSPRDANAPADERERLIAHKSAHVAYYIVASGGFVAIGALFFGIDRVLVANGLFFAMVLGEAVNDGARIVYFRRGV